MSLIHEYIFIFGSYGLELEDLMKRIVSQRYKAKLKNNNYPSLFSIIVGIAIVIFICFIITKLNESAIETCVKVTGNRTECIKNVGD